MVAGYPKHEVIYFLPEQIVFLVKGDSRNISTDALLKWANDTASKWKDKAKQASVLADKVKNTDITVSMSDPELCKSVWDFKPPAQRPLDIKKQRATLQTSDNPNYTSGLRRPYMENIWQDVNKRGPFTLVFAKVSGIKKQANLLDLILFLDENRKKAPGGKLQVVSPNWLASGGSEPGTVGGPGGRPLPYDGKANTKAYMIKPNSNITSFQNRGGQGVVVAILDTAPPKSNKKDLDAIYAKWADKKNHLLVKTLLDPAKRRLTVHSNGDLDLAPLRDVQADGHEYDMTDHGLFVAGIIHSLAPQADLHLFRVLNRYGVGDLVNIAQSLRQVYVKSLNDSGFKNKKLVVNLSLTLNIPLEDGHLSDLGSKILYNSKSSYESDFCTKLQNLINSICRLIKGPPWLERQAWPLEWICDLIPALGSGVIAAAGNNYDERRQAKRPQACYPAAFKSVLGVGALPRSKTPLTAASPGPETSSYSNLADRPPRIGIATLGGEEGNGEGVLGIYLGKFPVSEGNRKPTENTNGWAWWCGTSFATPIISGMIAAVLSTDSSLTAEGAIQVLHDVQSFQPTPGGEDIFDVTQGP